MNHLSSSSSPYLLQHAGNPVDWYPWGDEAFEKARSENKLVLVSIGYSACHWCHVMEHQSFEDHGVAKVMNDFFVCIKVDREERPDIDQVYMSAVQLMTGSGGWPLNCFTLPDGKPVYGGTYFPKDKWVDVLMNLADMYRKDKARVLEYAEQLTTGVNKLDGIPLHSKPESKFVDLADECVLKWKPLLDSKEGGPARAPKFPLPNNYLFLLAYAERTNDTHLKDHIQLTAQKMASGGIYDQLGGGFCRYSVDALWKVPHFEKMLYDNAQLITLYSKCYSYFGNPLYKQVVYETIEFAKAELSGVQGNFYSAIDADSEGTEGKYYVWTKQEVEQVLGENSQLFSEYYGINETGYWEHDNYILLRSDNDAAIAKKFGISETQLNGILSVCRKQLLTERNKRIRPGLDDKTLASWNGLMITGLLDAYDAFGEERFLKDAKKCADFIKDNLIRDDFGLWHAWKQNASINGYLEDYAFVIQSFIRLYQCTFDRSWLDYSKNLSMYALDHFGDDTSPFLFFTSDQDPPLFSRKHELQDNVIPSSNSQMAHNLYLLGRYFEMETWISKSKLMCKVMSSEFIRYGSAWSNWLLLAEYFIRPEEEVVICGEDALLQRKKFVRNYHPYVLLAGSLHPESLPLLVNRHPEKGTLIYRCVDKICGLPMEDAADLK
ncbi:MAG TPA: thioredoxin domain-containing protein [Bacteroidia bacterium]|nr:thioredoxin domain-containing protein [Bacteroidia bacterium]